MADWQAWGDDMADMDREPDTAAYWAEKLRQADRTIAELRATVAEAVRVMDDLRPEHRGPGCWCSYGRDTDRAGHKLGCAAAMNFTAKHGGSNAE